MLDSVRELVARDAGATVLNVVGTTGKKAFLSVQIAAMRIVMVRLPD